MAEDNVSETDETVDVREARASIDELVELLKRGLTTLAESKGISDEELESVYSLAYDYYKTGRYPDAETLFRFLVIYSHTNKKYWMGLAAVYQAQRRYNEAIVLYTAVAMFMDITWVKPSYYAAECYLAAGNREMARQALVHVRGYADKTTEEGRTYLAKADALEKVIEAKK